MGKKSVDLTHVGRERLHAAVSTAIQKQAADAQDERRMPTTVRLRQAAEAAIQQSDEDQARYFQSILEIGYLVASADGFAEEERRALADLLERATGAAAGHDALELHFRDLDDAVELLGRKERLRRAAADFEDAIGRTEAMGFAALVAVADGRLAEPEMAALAELGSCLELTDEQVEQTVDAVVQSIRREIGD